MKQKGSPRFAVEAGFAPILIVIIIAGLVGGYLLYQNRAQPDPLPQLSDNTQNKPTIPTQQVTQPPQNNISVSPAVQNGASLENIKYTLPSGWKTETDIRGADKKLALIISPNTGPGLFVIKVYDYPNNIGRREYYCKITDYCIERTYFTQRQIGNISGYTANALDNSSGGTEYFGAKGNKFYIISTVRDITSTSDEFNTYSNEVLNSLIF